jgi:phenylacetate-CoA ligase
MSGLAESIYFATPIWTQQAMIAGYGWWWYRRRFGPHFHRSVTEFKLREHWTADEFRFYQEQQLGKILAAAWRSPYYHAVFSDAGVSPGMKPFDVLRRIPLLSKETLRTRGRDLLTETRVPKGTIVFKSSGTTGTPTEIYYTPEFHALELAVPEARNLNWAGVTYHERRVMFGVRKVCPFDQDRAPFWRFSPAENMAYASIYHLSPRFLPYYLEFLRSYNPGVVMGYPSALNTIASYALEKNDLPTRAKAVFPTSETVTDDIRERIEAAFQCRIYDRYCAVEMCLFASQCEYGRYHVSPEVGIIEIVDPQGKKVRPGEMGEVICTGLQNTLQPLIRYRIGDVARWASDQTCACGRAMPILEAIEGRFEDICYTPDGREVLRFDTVFKGVENIREAQVVQEGLAAFTIYVVSVDGFGAKEIERIKHNMRLHVGNVQTEIKPVNLIPRTASGKFRAVVCNLSPHETIGIRQVKSFECESNTL